MISHPFRCIFIHIPKTGGTSVESVIWPNEKDRVESNLWMGLIDKYSNKYQTGGLQHLAGEQIIVEVGDETFNNYFKFSIVRNPWDKAVSQFAYTINKRKDLQEYLGINQRTSFKKYLQKTAKKEHVQWKKQTDFIYNQSGELMVDDILRFETLNQEFERIKRKLGLGISLPHENKSSRKHYRHYYNNYTIELVRELYNEDVIKLNYEFEY